MTGEEREMNEEAPEDRADDTQFDEDYRPDRVMILFMGSHHQHALTSIQHYVPDAVHIITSDDFREKYVRRLNEWSKKYGFRKGKVESVPDLFERTATDSLLSCVFRIAGHENNHSDGRMMPHMWRVGITGGTMHMAAVATLASNILDSQAFYVVKPEEGEAVMPNKQVIELPTLISLKTAMALNPADVPAIMEASEGTLDDLFENTEVEPWLLARLEAVGLFQTHPSEPRWNLTWSGHQILTMMSSGPMFNLRLGDEMRRAEASSQGDNFEGGFYA